MGGWTTTTNRRNRHDRGVGPPPRGVDRRRWRRRCRPIPVPPVGPSAGSDNEDGNGGGGSAEDTLPPRGGGGRGERFGGGGGSNGSRLCEVEVVTISNGGGPMLRPDEDRVSDS